LKGIPVLEPGEYWQVSSGIDIVVDPHLRGMERGWYLNPLNSNAHIKGFSIGTVPPEPVLSAPVFYRYEDLKLPSPLKYIMLNINIPDIARVRKQKASLKQKRKKQIRLDKLSNVRKQKRHKELHSRAASRVLKKIKTPTWHEVYLKCT
jgi:hypothetical protein